MKLLYAVSCLFALCFSAQAHAVLIDFDSLPNGTIVSNQFADQGVVFSQFEDGVQTAGPQARNLNFNNAGTGNGLFNIIGSPFLITNASRADVLVISFLEAVSDVSFVVGGDTDLTRFDVFGVEDPQIPEETVVNDSGGFRSLAFSGLISRVEVRQGKDNFTFRLDNLQFEIAAVPEPGAIALFLMGLLLLAGRRITGKAQ